MRAPRPLLVALLVAALALPATAAPAGVSQALEARAADVAARMVETPEDLERLFTPDMLQALSAERLAALFASLRAKHGAVEAVTRLPATEPTQGRFLLGLSRGVEMELTIYVEPQAPHRISGMWFGPPMPRVADLAGMAGEFAKLPGQSAFSAARLEDRGPVTLARHAGAAPFGVGSAFKLFLLAAAIEDVEAGRRRWSDVLTLQPRHMSLPSGTLQKWPPGSPLTLHTAAGLMISASDNTATDHVLVLLGRERVERRLAAYGVRQPELNMPLLATIELFKLKWGNDKAATEAFVRGDVAKRRAVLAGPMAKMPASAVATGVEAPTRIAELEWFASTDDLVRTLDWLRRHTERGPGAPGRGLMAINSGLTFGPEWSYVGYKGGSEPGVLNMSYLLRRKDGRWYALSATWNDSSAALDEARFFGLVQRAAHMLAAVP